VVYGAAQGLSGWVARYAQGRGTRPQYEQFERPALAPPGAVFPGYVPLAFGRRRLWAATADSALLCMVMVRYGLLGLRVDHLTGGLAPTRRSTSSATPSAGHRRPAASSPAHFARMTA
jgi:tryptophan-rich sensory protein